MPSLLVPHDEALRFKTARLRFEPITEADVDRLWDLFRDPELHQYVPFHPPTFEGQKPKFLRWSKRVSPDGKQLRINWLAYRLQASSSGLKDVENSDLSKPIAHFQIGMDLEGPHSKEAMIGYLVSRSVHRQGIAYEGCLKLIDWLKTERNVEIVRATLDIRNTASMKLCEKLGMSRVGPVSGPIGADGKPANDSLYEMRVK